EDAEHVGDEVDDHVDTRDEQGDRLDHFDIPVVDRVDQGRSDAGVAEQELDHHYATGEPGELQRDDLRHGTDRVWQRVSGEHDAFGQPLEPGHLDVAAVEDLTHRRAHHTGDVRRDDQCECEHG